VGRKVLVLSFFAVSIFIFSLLWAQEYIPEQGEYPPGEEEAQPYIEEPVPQDEEQKTAPLPPSNTIYGYVTAKDSGLGVSGVRVSLKKDGFFSEASTGKDGSYVFEGLSQGSYEIRFEAYGRYFLDEKKEEDTERVEFPPLDRQQIAVINKILRVGAAISGRVLMYDRATPVNNVKVSLYNQRTNEEISSVPTKSGGRFSFEPVPPGEGLLVKVEAPGYYSIRKQDISLKEGETLSDLDFVLPLPASGISGTVMDAATLSPVEGVELYLKVGGDEVVAQTKTNSYGKYLLSVPPGSYNLSAGKAPFRETKFPHIIVAENQIVKVDIYLRR
jgi:5-hydroxyisourate hydrolase-like protein (transthyretin family)